MQNFVEQLLTEEKSARRTASTLLDIEHLTMEVGDEIARQLASGDLAQRARETAEQQRFPCPACGRECEVQPDLEPLILQGPRGEIEYSEPRCHCRSCRRDFFPGGQAIAASRA